MNGPCRQRHTGRSPTNAVRVRVCLLLWVMVVAHFDVVDRLGVRVRAHSVRGTEHKLLQQFVCTALAG